MEITDSGDWLAATSSRTGILYQLYLTEPYRSSQLSTIIQMTKKHIIVLAAALFVLLIAGLVPYNQDVAVSTKQVSFLSAKEVASLKKRVEREGDSAAAMKLAIYYDRYAGDMPHYYYWLRRASNLGDPSARKRWSELKDTNVESVAAKYP